MSRFPLPSLARAIHYELLSGRRPGHLRIEVRKGRILRDSSPFFSTPSRPEPSEGNVIQTTAASLPPPQRVVRLKEEMADHDRSTTKQIQATPPRDLVRQMLPCGRSGVEDSTRFSRESLRSDGSAGRGLTSFSNPHTTEPREDSSTQQLL